MLFFITIFKNRCLGDSEELLRKYGFTFAPRGHLSFNRSRYLFLFTSNPNQIMCGRVKYYNRTTLPNSLMNIITKDGILAANWGLIPTKGDMQYNSRVENLSIPARKRSGILELEGFYEKEYFFHMPGNVPMKIGVTWRETERGMEFSMITRGALPPVAGIHDRMPLLIGDESKWLNEGFILPPKTLLEREKAA